MTPDYDDSDWTREEMLALAELAFDDADNAGPIPAEPIPTDGLTDEDLEDLALSRGEQFNEIRRSSQE